MVLKRKERNEKERKKRSSSCYFPFLGSSVYIGGLGNSVRWRLGAEGRAQRISSYSWETGLPTTKRNFFLPPTSDFFLILYTLCSSLSLNRISLLMFPYCPQYGFKMQVVYVAPSHSSSIDKS